MKDDFLEKIRLELSNLNNSGEISLLDLIVYDEIECQLEEELDDKEIEKIFNASENAYLKSENGNDLQDIVNYCIEHKDELDKITTYDILMNY